MPQLKGQKLGRIATRAGNKFARSLVSFALDLAGQQHVADCRKSNITITSFAIQDNPSLDPLCPPKRVEKNANRPSSGIQNISSQYNFGKKFILAKNTF